MEDLRKVAQELRLLTKEAYFIYSPTQTPEMTLEEAKAKFLEFVDEMYWNPSAEDIAADPETTFPVDVDRYLVEGALSQIETLEEIEELAESIEPGFLNWRREAFPDEVKKIVEQAIIDFVKEKGYVSTMTPEELEGYRH